VRKAGGYRPSDVGVNRSKSLNRELAIFQIEHFIGITNLETEASQGLDISWIHSDARGHRVEETVALKVRIGGSPVEHKGQALESSIVLRRAKRQNELPLKNAIHI
jgi:hypothetical protein